MIKSETKTLARSDCKSITRIDYETKDRAILNYITTK